MVTDSIQTLKENGFDVDIAIRRVMGKKDYYLKIVKKFPEDDSFAALKAALRSGDLQNALERAYTLQGISGNAGITPVYAAVSSVADMLSAGEVEGISPYIDTLETACIRAVNIIGEI